MADHVHRGAQRRRGLRHRLAGLPRRARAPADAPEPGELPAQRAARHARRLGPPARAPRVPGGRARPGGDDGRAAHRRAGRRAARAAVLRRRALRRAPAAAVARPGPGAPGPRPPRGGRGGDRAARRRRATPRTAWRCGSRGPPCSSPATTCRPSSCPCCRRPARATRTSRRCGGSSRSSSRRRTSCPATARSWRARGRWPSCARTWRTSRRCPGASCRSRGAGPAQQNVHKRNVERVAA